MAIYFFVAFLLLMVGIGIWAMRKTQSLNDYFLGGRQVGVWMSAMAYGTTYFSAVLFIGFAGKLGWAFGLNAIWIAVGNAIGGSLLAWLVLGKRTRRMSQNLDAMTMPEFFEARFESPHIRPLTAILIFVFLLPYSASVYKGLGHLFEMGFNISYNTALILMATVTGLYLVLGGYLAVTLTDFIQGIIMFFGSLAMVWVMTDKAGGFTQAWQTIQANYPQHVPEARQPGMLALGSLIFMTSFGTWGLPQMVQKFYAIKNEKLISRAAVVTTLFALVIGFSAYFIGSMTHAFYSPAQLPLTDGKPDFDQIIPNLLHEHLPEPLMALVLLLVFSASMSTLASLILVSSSSVAIDLYQGRINPKASKGSVLTLMRFLSAIFVAMSYFIAMHKFSVIVTLMSVSWGVIAGAFMAPLIYSLFWKRVTAASIYAGMFAGVGSALTLFGWLGEKQTPLASSIAMLIPFAVIPVVTLMTQPPSAETLAKAFAQPTDDPAQEPLAAQGR